jgi:hypothetical protein
MPSEKNEKRLAGKGAPLALATTRRDEAGGSPSADANLAHAGPPLSDGSGFIPMGARFVSAEQLLRVTDLIGAAHFACLRGS